MFSPLPKVTWDVNKTKDNNLLAKPSLLVSNTFNTVRHKLLMLSPVTSQASRIETRRPLCSISRIQSLYWWTVVTCLLFEIAFSVTIFFLRFWFTPNAFSFFFFFKKNMPHLLWTPGMENCRLPSCHNSPVTGSEGELPRKMPFWSVPTAVLVPAQLSHLLKACHALVLVNYIYIQKYCLHKMSLF